MAESNFNIFYNVISGRLKDSATHYNGINPFNEEELWQVPVATEEDLENAVNASRNAFIQWRSTTIQERRRCIKALASALLAQKEDWVNLLSKEAGQPPELAESEVEDGCEWLVALSSVNLPEHVSHEDNEVKVITKYYPLGVVAAICPWNFPLFLACTKLASAVTTGNTIIIKPSPYTPYTALKLAELAQQFFPPGVVQALGGNNELGVWMTKHPNISKISFTGSTATGKKVAEAAAPTLKRITLELGGNDAAIVHSDVDIDNILPQIVEDAFIHAGQTCIASKRIYVHSSIYENFMQKFVAACRELKPGQKLMSPLQNRMQFEKVKRVLKDCEERGCEFALGGSDSNTGEKGYHLLPAIVSNPADNSVLVQEEQFGPIVPILAWDDTEVVIQRVNDTDQGLGATVWSRDVMWAEMVANRLEAGSVWINRGARPMPTALFAGVKQSGLSGEWGELGMLNYCNARTLHFAK